MDAYKIGVSIVLANGVSNVLALISKDLLGVHGDVKKLEGAFTRLPAAIGLASAAIGTGIVAAMSSAIEKAGKLNDEVLRLKNMGDAVAAVATTPGFKSNVMRIAETYGLPAATVARLYGMPASMLGPEEAQLALEPNARLARALSFHTGRSLEDSEHDVNTAIRAGDEFGHLTGPDGRASAAQIERWNDLLMRITTATHGTVSGGTLFGISQQAGAGVLKHLSDEGVYGIAAMAQVLGGNRVGTSLMALSRQFAGGKMTAQTAQALADNGILRPGEYGTDHGQVVVNASATKRLGEMLQHDPRQFMDFLVRQMESHGITQLEDQMRELHRILGTNTEKRYVQDYLANRNQINAEVSRMPLGAGVNGVLANMDSSLSANLQNMSTAWGNLMTALGGPGVTPMIEVVKRITQAFNALNNSIQDPARLEQVTQVIAALAGAIGGVLIAAAGIAIGTIGSIPLVVGAVVGALSALVVMNWQAIRSGFDTVNAGLDRFRTALNSLASTAWEKITAMFDGIKNAIMAFVSGVGDILGKIGWMFGFGGNKVPGIGEAPKHKSNFEGPSIDRERGSFIPASFNPSQQHIAVPINNRLTLNIDGQAIAQTIIDKISEMTTFPTGAPSPDGVGRHFAGDHNYADV